MISSIIKKYRSLPIQVRASFWFLISAFLQKGISVISTPVFTRLLSVAEYGQYNVFNSWLGIATVFVSLNLSLGVYSQGLVKFEKEQAVFSSSLQGLTILLLFLWTVIYFIFQDFWNKVLSMTTVQILAMLILIWSSAVFGFWSAEQRMKFQYRALVIVTIIVSVAKPLMGVLFVINADDKVTARIMSLLVVELAGYSGLCISQMRKGRKVVVFKFWKHALLFNIPLIPHYLSQTVLNSADRIMIESMVGDVESGIYSLAYSISSIMTLFNTALSQTISPWIYQKIRDKKTMEIAPVAYGTMVLIACVNIVLILLAPEIIAFFAPKEYADAIWVIPPIAMSVYFMYCYNLFAKFAFYYEETKLIMVASVSGAVLNIVLNYYFIQLFGYQAAGYTTLVCYIMYSFGHYYFMNRTCDKYCEEIRPYSTKVIMLITVPFLIIGFALMILYKYTTIRVVLVLALVVWLFWNRALLLKRIQMFFSIRNNPTA